LPLRGWCYDYFPPARYFKHSTIFSVMGLFAALVLAAVTAADVARADAAAHAQRWRLAAAAIVSGLAGLIACRLAATVPGQSEVMPGVRLLPGYLGWSVVLALGLLLAFGTRPWSERFLPGALCALALADACQTSWLIDLEVSCPVAHILQQWKTRMTNQVQGLDLMQAGGLDRQFELHGAPWDPAGMKHLLTKTAVLQAGSALTSDFHQAWAAIAALRHAALGPHRIWFSPTAVETPWNKTTFHQFFLRNEELRDAAPPVVVHRRAALLHPLPTNM
jgi:hypothetical protein